MKIARPAARKSTGKNKPTKSGPSSRQGQSQAQAQAKKLAAEAPSSTPSQTQNPRRRFVELPKVPGELPTPVATFYF